MVTKVIEVGESKFVFQKKEESLYKGGYLQKALVDR